ncbi:MAG: transglutaminase family protein, partial [Methylococcaceae bacterium]
MKLRVSCNLDFQITEASVLILMLRPYRGLQQWINSEVYTIEPAIQIIESTDSFGNSCQHLSAPVGNFLIHTSSEVIANDNSDIAPGAYFVEIQHLPNEVLPFLLPSRYCESDRFGDLAREIIFDALPGYDQVSKINAWVRESIRYLPGSSEFPLSAVEVH